MPTVIIIIMVSNFGFWWEEKTRVPREKPFRAKYQRTKKLNAFEFVASLLTWHWGLDQKLGHISGRQVLSPLCQTGAQCWHCSGFKETLLSWRKQWNLNQWKKKRNIHEWSLRWNCNCYFGEQGFSSKLHISMVLYFVLYKPPPPPSPPYLKWQI